ncbi:hypothetical protein AB0O20_27855 [Streptomyces kronopolitis]|uniref:hypothetical protein n=1 Tax=Streptomyces kronopolitis TaxID=1612435 RepID=UPI003446167D
MQCPGCQQEMTPPGVYDDRYWCGCGRVAVEGETPEDIEIRERGRQQTLDLLDYAIALRGSGRATLLKEEPEMGQLIQTRGCGKCGGTMYKTVDTDENGNPTNEGPYVCQGCGNCE